jgi:uncharacterized membrane protein
MASLFAYPHLPIPGIFLAGHIEVGRPIIAFVLPIAAVVALAVMDVVWRRDVVRDRDEALDRVYGTVRLGALALIVGLHGVILARLTAAYDSAIVAAVLPRATPVLLGAVLMLVGNVLPRTRPNLVFGIRTAWLLAHREQWAHVQRVAGYAIVGTGITCVAAGLLLRPGPPVFAALSAAFLASAGVCTAAYRRAIRTT